jgi:hypothetical protein
LIAERAANRNGDARHAVDMCQTTLQTVRTALMRGERKPGPISEDDLPPIADPFQNASPAHLLLLSFFVVDAPEPKCRELDGAQLHQLYQSARVNNAPVTQALGQQEFNQAINFLSTQGILRAKPLKKRSATKNSSSSSHSLEPHEFSYSLSNVTPDDVILKGYEDKPKLVKKYFEINFHQFLSCMK